MLLDPIPVEVEPVVLKRPKKNLKFVLIRSLNSFIGPKKARVSKWMFFFLYRKDSNLFIERCAFRCVPEPKHASHFKLFTV